MEEGRTKYSTDYAAEDATGLQLHHVLAARETIGNTEAALFLASNATSTTPYPQPMTAPEEIYRLVYTIQDHAMCFCLLGYKRIRDYFLPAINKTTIIH